MPKKSIDLQILERKKYKVSTQTAGKNWYYYCNQISSINIDPCLD